MVTTTIVCGPPCAGKTTWVQRHASPGDTVLDLDSIAQELGSPVRWMHPAGIQRIANVELQRRLEHAVRTGTTTWVIRSLPEEPRRAALAQAYDAKVVVLDPGQAECIARARRDCRPSGTTKAIKMWYWKAARNRLTTPQVSGPTSSLQW